MAQSLLTSENSVLVVIDVQPTFLKGIFEADRVVRRVGFLAEVAHRLGVPILATEQVPHKMGGTDPTLLPWIGEPIGKSAFSGLGEPEFVARLAATGRRKVILVGIETHICVSLTAGDLLSEGYEVVVSPDACSAGDLERHKLGMERIRDAGAVPAHTEAIAYEWMKSATHPEFRAVLDAVKRSR